MTAEDQLETHKVLIAQMRALHQYWAGVRKKNWNSICPSSMSEVTLLANEMKETQALAEERRLAALAAKATKRAADAATAAAAVTAAATAATMEDRVRTPTM